MTIEKTPLISLEGGDGTGKSTHVGLLYRSFIQAGHNALQTREPGGSQGAEDIRRLVVEGEVLKWSPLAEFLLHCAARVDHLEKTIEPALKRKQWVISDRFIDSTIAYQVYAQHLNFSFVKSLIGKTTNGIEPSLTIILDVAPEIGLERAAHRGNSENRYEQFDLQFHRALRNGFRKIANRARHRCRLVDASGTIREVHTRILSVINAHFSLSLYIAEQQLSEIEALR